MNIQSISDFEEQEGSFMASSSSQEATTKELITLDSKAKDSRKLDSTARKINRTEFNIRENDQSDRLEKLTKNMRVRAEIRQEFKGILMARNTAILYENGEDAYSSM